MVFRPAQSNIPFLSSPQCLFPSDILQRFVSKTLTLSCRTSTFVDFTLSNARRFHSSMGNPLGRKGLRNPFCYWNWPDYKIFFSILPHVSMRREKHEIFFLVSLFQLILVQILVWLQSGRMNSNDEGMLTSPPEYQLHRRRASIYILLWLLNFVLKVQKFLEIILYVSPKALVVIKLIIYKCNVSLCSC